MRSRGWRRFPPHSPAVAQITLSSVKHFLSLNDVDCYRVTCSDVTPHIFDIFHAFKVILYFITINSISHFMLFGVILYLFAGILASHSMGTGVLSRGQRGRGI